MGSDIDETIRFGMRCNFNCLFCNILNNEEIDERSLPEMKRIVDAVDTNVQFISISGGEPLLYPHLDELIDYTVKKGWNVSVQTNASLITPNRAKKMKELGVGLAFVNFPSHIPEVYAKLTATKPKVFEAAVRGIKLLMDAGIRLTINIVVNELNYKDLVPFVHFVNDNFPGVNSMNFSVIQPHGNAKINSELVPDYRDVKPFLNQAIVLAEKVGIPVKNPFCGLPICMVYDSITLKNNAEYKSGSEVRNKGAVPVPLSRILGDKFHPPSCGDCYLKNFCLGVWDAYYKIRGDVVEPPYRALRIWPNG